MIFLLSKSYEVLKSKKNEAWMNAAVYEIESARSKSWGNKSCGIDVKNANCKRDSTKRLLVFSL